MSGLNTLDYLIMFNKKDSQPTGFPILGNMGNNGFGGNMGGGFGNMGGGGGGGFGGGNMGNGRGNFGSDYGNSNGIKGKLT